jgi:hypothetical protein
MGAPVNTARIASFPPPPRKPREFATPDLCATVEFSKDPRWPAWAQVAIDGLQATVAEQDCDFRADPIAHSGVTRSAIPG